MRWIVMLEGNGLDIERLLGESPHGVAATESPREMVLEFADDEHDVVTAESRQAARTEIESAVRRLNGFGKLRWGRAFNGVTPQQTVRRLDSAGRSAHEVFVGPAYGHMLPVDHAAYVERLGFPRPQLPVGIEDVNALKLAKVSALADRDPDVARVLCLVELILEGDADINWAAGYSALEVIDHTPAGGA